MERRGYLLFMAIVVILFAAVVIYQETHKKGTVEAHEIVIDDYDPTTDIEVIFRIDRIRKVDFAYGEEPVVAMDITIDGKTTRGVGPWGGVDSYPRWRYIQDVNDSKEYVTLTVKLYEMDGDEEIPCDISPRTGDYTGTMLHLNYSIKTGTWRGDDFLKDENGYGHVSGTEDGTTGENDYELWFSVYQTDADGDRLTWYAETYVYHTDPLVNDAEKDYDNDGIPMGWEVTYGYDPFTWENHTALDDDSDGIQNVEEYMMAEYGADPFRRDVFVEVDFMENLIFGTTTLPEYSKEKVISAFTKHNIQLHIDDGLMGGGGEVLPYEKYYTQEKLSAYYKSHFLHNGEEEWRRGIFRYCVMAQYTFPANRQVAGYSYWPANDDAFSCFVVGTRTIKNYRITPLARETAIGSLFMHELGHTLGIFWHTYHGCDNSTNNYPWLPGWSKYENYKSCMNYRYAWSLIDYSDGSHGTGDFDDWSHVDPAFFEKRFFAEPPIIL